MIHSAPYPADGLHSCTSVYVLQRLLRTAADIDPDVCEHPDLAAVLEWTTDDPNTRELFVKSRLGSQQVRRLCARAWELASPLLQQVFVLQTLMGGVAYTTEALGNLRQLLEGAHSEEVAQMAATLRTLQRQIAAAARRTAGLPPRTSADTSPPGPSRRAIRLFESFDHAQNPSTEPPTA